MARNVFISATGARCIGVDVGNYDTKTQCTITPSSCIDRGKEEKLATEFLFYNGKYYLPSKKRDKQMFDKRKNDHMLLMTLFGIAKEILAEVTNPNMSADAIQKAVDEVAVIKLGVGLPVGHFSNLVNDYVKYYDSIFKNGISFAYKGDLSKSNTIYFNLKVEKTTVFPQDLIAVIYNDSISIPKHFEDYDIIGIGGGTLDVIKIRDNIPQTEDVKSFDLGTTFLYSYVSNRLSADGINDLDQDKIRKIIDGYEDPLVGPQKINLIKEYVKTYTTDVVNELLHFGLKPKSYPTVFIGGGALLLKSYLEADGNFSMVNFVPSVNENAIYYAQASSVA